MKTKLFYQNITKDEIQCMRMFRQWLGELYLNNQDNDLGSIKSAYYAIGKWLERAEQIEQIEQ